MSLLLTNFSCNFSVKNSANSGYDQGIIFQKVCRDPVDGMEGEIVVHWLKHCTRDRKSVGLTL